MTAGQFRPELHSQDMAKKKKGKEEEEEDAGLSPPLLMLREKKRAEQNDSQRGRGEGEHFAFDIAPEEKRRRTEIRRKFRGGPRRRRVTRTHAGMNGGCVECMCGKEAIAKVAWPPTF